MRKYIFIGAGTAAGAILRYLIREIYIDHYQEVVPLNTLIINVTGCFVLAVVLMLSIEILELSPNLRLGIATGLIGAFTTFSTFCKETVEVLYQGYYFSAISYVVISAFLGFMATYFGIVIAREVIAKRIKERRNSKLDESKAAESEEE